MISIDSCRYYIIHLSMYESCGTNPHDSINIMIIMQGVIGKSENL